jgi:hypothetical protein
MFQPGKQVYNKAGELLGTVIAVVANGMCVKVQPPIGSSVEKWTQVYDVRDVIAR